MLDPRKGDSRLEKMRATMERPITVPTLALCGRDDLRAELMTDQANTFPANTATRLLPAPVISSTARN
jgi:hypothetical protein